jgi:DNA-3-methyladenine glycosylase I
MPDKKQRCGWVDNTNECMVQYHDREWGVPVHDDTVLFEFLILESFQAGLSWNTILNKRENFRKAFDDFDYQKIAKYQQSKLDALRENAGIIRNRLKIAAAVTNAKAFLDIQREFGSFDTYIWGFIDGVPVVNSWNSLSDLPATTELSDKISKDLKKTRL